MPLCPICNQEFPASRIQRHANECLDRMTGGGGGDDVDAPAAPAPVAPARPPSPPQNDARALRDRVALREAEERMAHVAHMVGLERRRRELEETARRATPASLTGRGRRRSESFPIPAAAAPAPASAAPAPASAASEPAAVTEREVADFLNAIHIRTPDEVLRADAHALQSEQEDRAATTAAAGRAAAHPARSMTSTRLVESAPDARAITGLLYVRVMSVELTPAKDMFGAFRTPHVDVHFEQASFSSGAAKGPTGELEDAEFLFTVDHYYGGAYLSLEVIEKGLLSRTSLGKAEISAGDIVRHQLTILRMLGVVVTSTTDGRVALKCTPDITSEEYDGPSAEVLRQRWTIPGRNPCIQELALPLAHGTGSGVVKIQVEFIFQQMMQTCGPLEMTRAHCAAAGGHVKLLRYLQTRSASGGKLTSTTSHAWRPIDFAVRGSTAAHVRTVEYIVHAANSETDDTGLTRDGAVSVVRNGEHRVLSMMRMTLREMLQLREADLVTLGTSTISRACEVGCVDSIRLLLIPGDDLTRSAIRRRDAQSRTPFMLAAMNGHTAVLKLLTTAPYNLSLSDLASMRDNAEHDSLLLACRGGHAGTVAFLLTVGAVDTFNSRHQGPLHLAASATPDAAAVETLKLLAAAGPTITADDQGRRPLHCAAAAGNAQAATFLVSTMKHNINVADVAGLSAYDVLHDTLDACGDDEARASSLRQVASYLRSVMEPSEAAAADVRVDYRRSQRSLSAPVAPAAAAAQLSAAPAPAAVAAPQYAPLQPRKSTWDDGFVGDDDSYAYEDDDGGRAHGGSMASPVASSAAAAHADGGAASAADGIAGAASMPARSPALIQQDSSVDGGIRGKPAPFDIMSHDAMPMPSALGFSRQRSVEIYDEDDVAAVQTRILTNVANLLKVPLSHAGLMLRRFKWDAQAVVDAYTSDPAAITAKCGISAAEMDMDVVLARYRRGIKFKRAKDKASSGAARPWTAKGATKPAVELPVLDASDRELTMCNACLEEVEAWRMVSAGCGHELCDTCWAGHFGGQLQEYGKDVVYKSRCPEVGCTTVVQQVMWEELAREADLRQYKQFTLHTFVPLTGNVVWCPNPKCTRAIRYRHQRSDLGCACGLRFCITCWCEAHSPATCDEFTQWKEDTAGLTDLLTNRLLMQNYKKCPRCGIFMERTAGCNHITCKCGHQWCYMCKGDWSSHGSATGGHYRCNIYESATNKTQMDWEGYSPEERERVFAKDKEKRAEKFNEAQVRTRRMEDGMERTRHLLEVCRKVAADPNLLLKRYGITTPTASPASAAAAKPGTSVASPSSATSSTVGGLPGLMAAAARQREADEATANNSVWSSMWNAVLTTIHRKSVAGVEESGFDSSDEDSTPSASAASAATHRASPSSSPSSSSPTVDAATEHVIARERRRLHALIAAYETLYEFHRIEKWCTVHLFYMPDGSETTLLRYKLEVLQDHASSLFDMLNSNEKLMVLDDARLRDQTSAVRQFCHNILEDVESAQAMRGRVKPLAGN